jgi:outer membrane protein assembly factor BamB
MLLNTRRRRPVAAGVPTVLAPVAFAAAAVAMSLLAPGLAMGTAGAAARPAGWSNTTLDVVGGPVVAGGTVLVIDVTARLDLQLSALAPQSGRVLWSTEISPSYTPPVVLVQPVVSGDIALVLRPADGNASDPNMDIEGVDINTGQVKWKQKPTPIVTDAPVTCDGGADFCVAAFASNGTSTTLAYIDAATGQIAATVEGPARNLGMASPGSAAKGDLWSTFSAVPTFMQLSPSGAVSWQEPVAKIFGGKQYNPNFGWEFAARPGIDVGSVGYPTSGDKLDLDEFKTVGISVRNGVVEWSHPGFYMCGGALQFLDTDVICDLSGTVTEQKSLQFSGLGLTLEGLDSATGKVVWSLATDGAQAVVEDAPQPFLDDQHMAVHLSSGKWAVLDTANGRTAPVGAGEVFWCEDQPSYKLTAPEGATENGQRSSEPVYFGCTVTGAPAKGLPSSQPAAVGADVDGLFVWLSPKGLQATPAR